MTSSHRRWFAVALIAGLVGGACGDGSGDATRRALTPATTASSVAPTTSVSIGEGGPLLGEIITAIPDPGVHPVMSNAFAGVNDAAEICHDLPAWTEAMAVAVGRFERLIGRIQTSPALAAWRETDDAKALSDLIRDRLVLQDRCRNGSDGASDEEVRAATRITGRAVAIADWYRLRLHGLPPSVGAEFWYHADQLGHLLELERLTRADDGIDTVLVGTSPVKYGIDAQFLTDTTGRSTLNAGIPFLFADVMAPWIEQVRRRSRGPGRVVIGVGATDAFRQCTSDRADEMNAAMALQERAFATLPDLEAIDRERLLVGPGTPSYLDSPVLRSYRATTEFEGRGNGVVVDEPDAELTRADRGAYEALFADPEQCDAIVDALGDVVRELTAQRVEVVVVALPIHPDVLALVPGGAFTVAAINARHAELATAAGGRFLDLTTLLPANEFVDLTDPTRAGRNRITAEVAAELAG